MIKVGNKLARVGATFTLLVFFACNYAVAIDLPQPTSDFYVNDFAEILSSDTKEHIRSTSKRFKKEFDAQVVVTTVESLRQESLEEYSIAMAKKWGIGDSKTNKGILVLVSEKDREIRIDVGFGFEGSLNDAKCGRIIRKSSETLGKDLDAGAKMVYDLLMKEIGGSEFALDNETGDKGPFWDWCVVAFLSLAVVAYFFIKFSDAKKEHKMYSQNPENKAGVWLYFIVIVLADFAGSIISSSKNDDDDSDHGGGGDFGGGGASGKF
ncbi:hypothetical protein FACS1894198_6490 [Clostridia bacterium]|nr:hypothetical protein FACS1894198_6490 [Clostridia bacterium]